MILTGTTNAVDVILNVVGHIEIDNDADILHVQSSSSHISCYQHWESSFLELSQGAVTLSKQELYDDII